VTHPSKSKTRSVAAIGNGCVILAKAGIQVCVKSQWIPAFAGMTAEVTAVAHPSKSKTRSVAAIGNGCVILAKAGIHFDRQPSMDSRFRGNDGGESNAFAHPSKSKTRSVAAIGNG